MPSPSASVHEEALLIAPDLTVPLVSHSWSFDRRLDATSLHPHEGLQQSQSAASRKAHVRNRGCEGPQIGIAGARVHRVLAGSGVQCVSWFLLLSILDQSTRPESVCQGSSVGVARVPTVVQLDGSGEGETSSARVNVRPAVNDSQPTILNNCSRN